MVAENVLAANARQVLERRGERWVVRSFRDDGSLEASPVRSLKRVADLRPVGLTGSGEIVAVRELGMSSELLVVAREGAAPMVLHGGETVIRRSISTTSGAIAFAATSATEPEALWVRRRGKSVPSRIATWNAPSPFSVRSERIFWNSPDGSRIEGLLITPALPAAKLPTLLFLHGGPEDRVRSDFHFLATLHQGGAALALAARGWAVFLPNFRGSAGYGEESQRALQNGHYLDVPAADSLSGLDALVARGIADPERMAIAGFSYGGTLTAWIIGRDHRFRAAVPMAGDLDLLGDDRSRLRGARAIHALGGARSGPEDGLLDAWHAPEKYRSLSPLETAIHVRTPSLLVSTAMEHLSGPFHAAFFNGASLSGLPVRWAFYPRAWHGGSWSPEDRVDAAARVIEWLERWTLPPRSSERSQ